MVSESTPLLSPTRSPGKLWGDTLWAPKATYALANMAISAFSNFLPVFFESTAHFSKFQIGVLQTLPCICTIVGAPFWSAVGDKFQSHRLVHYMSILTGAVLVYAVSLFRSYSVAIVLTILANFLYAPSAPLLEHAVLDMIAKHGGEYGKQRLFASVGYGLGAYVAGVAVAASGIAWAFNLSVVFALASMVALYHIPVPSHHRNEEPDVETSAVWTPREDDAESGREAPHVVRAVPFSHAMRQLAQKTDVIALLVFVFLVGLMYGVLTSFLTLNLYDLSNQNAQIVGIAIMCETASEATAFFYSQKLISKLGTVNVLLLSVVGYAVRITYLAFMTNPWTALPFEFLHGITYGIFWAAATEYLFDAAPRGTEGTVMGLLNGILEGAGHGGGTLLGGYLYEHYGARTMWVLTDLGVPLALAGLAAFAYFKEAQETKTLENNELQKAE